MVARRHHVPAHAMRELNCVSALSSVCSREQLFALVNPASPSRGSDVVPHWDDASLVTRDEAFFSGLERDVQCSGEKST
jgi:hypothetical protein